MRAEKIDFMPPLIARKHERMSLKKFNLRDLIADAADLLRQAGIEDSRREARFLAAWALQIDLTALLTRDVMSEDAAKRFQQAVDRRRMREPMALITGRTGFWTLDLAVSPATLVPRGDSETLIEALLEARPERQSRLRILDLGTGTGCLLLAALAEYPNAFGVGVDLSADAAVLASRNAAGNGLRERSAFLCGHWADALQGRFDVVLSNPPYIETDVISSLMPEVRIFEPASALDGGTDGLDAYRLLIGALGRLLTDDGLAIFELGQGQDEDVARLALDMELRVRGVRKDLGGIGRALLIERTAGPAVEFK